MSVSEAKIVVQDRREGLEVTKPVGSSLRTSGSALPPNDSSGTPSIDRVWNNAPEKSGLVIADVPEH